MAVTRRGFAKAIGATVPLAVASAVAKDDALPDQNPGEFVIQRPSPLDPKRKVSIIGFGGVRLPVATGRLRNQMDPVDYPTATKYVDYALAHGINWFDSGYHYHGGDSERFFGHALSRYPRESFWFCTKAPPWDISSLADAKRIFKEQLERTRFGYFDVYMLHSLVHQEDYIKTFVKTGAIDYFREEKAKGRIRHFGFSFHGREDFMDYLLETQQWDVVTILVNGIDWRGPNRSESLLSKLRAKGIPAVGMESLAGGRLANMLPAAKEHLAKARPGLTDAAWSLKFAAEREGVMTAMTGFTRFEHLKEDISIFNEKGYKPLSQEEVSSYLEAIKINSGGGEGVPCSGCGYCMPCPYGVDIVGIFHWWNMKLKWSRLPSLTDPGDHEARLKFLADYGKRFGTFRGAERCIGCERCGKKCPQWQFRIPDELAKIERFVESVRRAEPDFRMQNTPGMKK